MSAERRKRIGVFINATDQYFTETFCKALREEAVKLNLDVYVFLTPGYSLADREYSSQESGIFSFVPMNRLDGIIAVPDGYEVFGFRRKLESMLRSCASCPIVTVRCSDSVGDQVYMDENEAIRPAIRHVLEHHNKKRVCFMAGFPDHPASNARLRCFREEMASHGLPIPEGAIYQGHMWFTDGPGAYTQFFETFSLNPEAVICANDFMAHGLVSVLAEKNIRVPEDVIVTGFDNSTSFSVNSVSLTTIEQDYSAMASAAVHQLAGRIREREAAGTNTPPMKIKVPSRLILGDSCGCGSHSSNHLKEDQESKSRRLNDINLWVSDLSYTGIGLASCDSLPQLHQALVPGGANSVSRGEDYYLCLFEEDSPSEHHFAESITDRVCLVSSVVNGRNDEMPMISFDRRDILPPLPESDPVPNFYIISLLHQQRSTFGYSVIRHRSNSSLIVIHQFRNVLISGALRNIHNRDTMQRLYEERRVYSITDSLTRIYNRRGLEEQILPLWSDLCRKHQSVAFIFFDMDHLKLMNDRYGHSAGDAAICSIAKAIKQTAGKNAVYARMGGDEFLVFLPEATQQDADLFIRRFESNLNQLNSEVAEPYRVSCSAGASVIELNESSELDQCIRRSDMMMYDRKARREAVHDEGVSIESMPPLEILSPAFSVCHVSGFESEDLRHPFCFASVTDEEQSLVCPEEYVPSRATDRDDGWKAFRFVGPMNFSLIGILARISSLLAAHNIPIFAVSTYNTDYILVKEENVSRAVTALLSNGFIINSPKTGKPVLN